MKRKPLLTLLFILGLLAGPARATSVKWLVRPEYETISYYSKDVFKCKKNGQFQLIDNSGKALLPAMADSVTEFSDGIALVLAKDKGNMRITGLLAEEGHRFVEVAGDFHTIFYSHFSEGMLVVANAKEELGYLDGNGKLAIPCKYRKARPFCKGWASVAKKNENAYYIDKNERPMIIQFNNGELSQATSFNEKGHALVSSKGKDRYAIINTAGQVVTDPYIPTPSVIREHDFAFNEEGLEWAARHNEMPSFESDVFAISANGVFGYQRGKDEIVVSPQFAYAGPFDHDCAIVALGVQYGVISLAEGSFFSSIEPPTVNFEGDAAPSLHYTISVPREIDSHQLSFRFDHGDGKMETLADGAMRQTGVREYTYTFTPHMDKHNDACTIKAEATMDGLLLWTDSIPLIGNTKRADPASDFLLAKPNAAKRADDKDLQKISSSVRNNSDESIEVTATFSVTALSGKNKIVSKTTATKVIEADKTAYFFLSIEVHEKEEITVTVTATSGQSTKEESRKITLIPYYYIE